jgi:hypothetical protein
MQSTFYAVNQPFERWASFEITDTLWHEFRANLGLFWTVMNEIVFSVDNLLRRLPNSTPLWIKWKDHEDDYVRNFELSAVQLAIITSHYIIKFRNSIAAGDSSGWNGTVEETGNVEASTHPDPVWYFYIKELFVIQIIIIFIIIIIITLTITESCSSS